MYIWKHNELWVIPKSINDCNLIKSLSSITDPLFSKNETTSLEDVYSLIYDQNTSFVMGTTPLVWQEWVRLIYTSFIMDMNRSEAYRTAVVSHREIQAVLPPSRSHVLSTQGSAVLYQTRSQAEMKSEIFRHDLKWTRASPPPWPCEPAAVRTLWKASRDGCSGDAGPPEPPAAPGSVWAPDLLWPFPLLLESERVRDKHRTESKGVWLTALDFEPLSRWQLCNTLWRACDLCQNEEMKKCSVERQKQECRNC